MKLYYRDMDVELYCGHVLDVLGSLPDGSVQACITSPPYWGLRDYGVPPQFWPEVRFTPMVGLPEVCVSPMSVSLGLESNPQAYVAHLVLVFREVRRVLKDDGVFWLNLGDSYAGSWGAQGGQGKTGVLAGRSACAQRQIAASAKKVFGTGSLAELGGLKAKDLMGIPWRVAFALQADGWWLRSDVVWSKPTPNPESVADRPTKAHEYVFLLSKSKRYFYDVVAVQERAVKGAAGSRFDTGKTTRRRTSKLPRRDSSMRNKRSVWSIATKPYRGAHFATMPPALARTCVLAGSRPGDVVLDPFSGAGTTGLAALNEGRRYLGVELNENYCRQSVERWRRECVQRPLLPVGSVNVEGGKPMERITKKKRQRYGTREVLTERCEDEAGCERLRAPSADDYGTEEESGDYERGTTPDLVDMMRGRER